MTRKRIVVDVHPDGTMSAATQGITGPSCLDEVARIEALCGGTIASSTLTDDYHMASAVDSLIDQAEITDGTT